MENQLPCLNTSTSAGLITANLKFPRIGRDRELSFALERFWSGEEDEEKLKAVAQNLRPADRNIQADAGIQQNSVQRLLAFRHVLDWDYGQFEKLGSHVEVQPRRDIQYRCTVSLRALETRQVKEPAARLGVNGVSSPAQRPPADKAVVRCLAC